MNSFERQAFEPPPPQPFVVLGRHGQKFKVRIFGHTRIMDRDTVLKYAAERRALGANVQLWPFINE